MNLNFSEHKERNEKQEASGYSFQARKLSSGVGKQQAIRSKFRQCKNALAPTWVIWSKLRKKKLDTSTAAYNTMKYSISKYG